MEKKGQPIHARLDLFPGDPVYDKYMEIKSGVGLLSHAELLRFLVTKFKISKKKEGEKKVAVETEAVPYALSSEKEPIALSEEATAALQTFYEKHRECIENADVLPQPMRAIAEFVKKECEGGKEDERG